MELKDLVGLHKLAGVSFDLIQDCNYRDANVMNFVLDGVTYSVIEDPSDGYRSAMDEIKVSKAKVSNRFKAVKVFCMMRSTEGYDHDVLDMYDVANAKLVLSVGTESYNAYYPTFVSNWQPENLAVNATAPADAAEGAE